MRTMSQLATPREPREMLIALHADRRLARRELNRRVEEVLALHASLMDTAAMAAADAGGARCAPAPAVAMGESAAAAAASECAAAAALGAHIITLLDADFPRVLAGMAQPPPVLVVRGALPPGPAVAVVGSRRADAYGLDAARYFARGLAAAGVVVISGLARGIDAAAHEGALTVPGGRTVAVVGCGLGVDYPRGHGRLAAAIAERGAVVSTFACGSPARPWHFPVRNRTIAALATVTLVVQATPRSGSLSTARHARELGRAVFAVPGPVRAALSWGPHELLRRGARLAGHPEDVLATLVCRAPLPPRSSDAAPCEGRQADGTVRAPSRPGPHSRNKEGASRRW